jgi:hypothetical protein
VWVNVHRDGLSWLVQRRSTRRGSDAGRRKLATETVLLLVGADFESGQVCEWLAVYGSARTQATDAARRRP